MLNATVLIHERLQERRPLIQCMTNCAANEFAANAVLALGAEPVFIEDSDEASDLVTTADALFINLGSLNRRLSEAIRRACVVAEKAKKPWVLDLSATAFLHDRNRFAQEIAACGPAIIRGRAPEIFTLADTPDSLPGTPDSAGEAVLRLSRRTGAVIVIDAPVPQIIAEGRQFKVPTGHSRLLQIIGARSMPGAVIAASLAVADSAIKAAVAGTALCGVAAAIAGEKSRGSGSFAAEFLDALGALNASILFERAKILQ